MVWTEAEKKAARKRTAAKAPERAEFWKKRREAGDRTLKIKKTPIKPETIKAVMPSKKEDIIRLGKPKEEKKGIIEKAKDFTARFNIQKQLKKSGSDIKVKEMIYTGPIIGGGSLIGKRIPSKTIEAAGKAAGLSKAGIAQVKHAIGTRRVSQVAQSLINPKSQSLMLNVMRKAFSKEALAIIGITATGAYTFFQGKWAQAEAPEPISIVMKDVLREAQRTGDYTLYNEAAAARDELLNLSTWETIISNSPFISPFIGIPNKIKGAKLGARIQDELARQQQISAELGESEEDKWTRIEEERKATREAERIEDEQYYAQVKKDIAKAKKEARREDEKYWANILRERENYEKDKREAEEKYWEDVRKLNAELKKEEQKQYQDYTRSNLGFGLL